MDRDTYTHVDVRLRRGWRWRYNSPITSMTNAMHNFTRVVRLLIKLTGTEILVILLIVVVAVVLMV